MNTAKCFKDTDFEEHLRTTASYFMKKNRNSSGIYIKGTRTNLFLKNVYWENKKKRNKRD